MSSLTKVGCIGIQGTGLTNFDGLQNLITVVGCEPPPDASSLQKFVPQLRGVRIVTNLFLESLEGLNNLMACGGDFFVSKNKLLTEFCPIFTLLSTMPSSTPTLQGLIGEYVVHSNLNNPTQKEVIDAGACMQDPDPTVRVIKYKVTLPDCKNPKTPLVVCEGQFNEGGSFTFPDTQLPTQYAAYQQFYNAFANAEFGVPVGALKEDVKIVIDLKGICEGGLIDNPDTKKIIELFFLSVEIIGDNSGSHSPLEYYWFENKKEAYLKMKLDNIQPLAEFINFDTNLLMPFFTVNGLNPDFNGIRKETDDMYFTIYAKHFSEVRLGVVNSITDVSSNNLELPTAYDLAQNYPNPFNPSTSISFSIPTEGFVTLSIFDVLGNEVAVLENGYKAIGNYSYSFDASNLTSGIYFYTIQVNSFVQTKKMLLMK